MPAPTLRQIYEEARRLHLYVRVRMNGVTVTFDQANPGFGAEGDFQPGATPTCRFTIPNTYVQEWMREFNNLGNRPAVTVDAGYNGQYSRVFTGHVINFEGDDTSTYINCAGQSEPLQRSWGDKTLQLAGIASSAVLTNALVAAGISQYFVNVPAWTIGTAKAIEINFQTWGDVINKVAEVFASPWFEMPSGQVRVELRDNLPSVAAFREYFAAELDGLESDKPAGIVNVRKVLPRLLQGTSLDERVQDVVNKFTVRGASIDQQNGDGTTTSVQIKTTATQTSPYIPSPPGLQEATLDNELIDTNALAATAALRHATLRGHLWTRGTFNVLGDPEIFLGASVRIENHYANVTGLWFVEAYSWSISNAGYTTTLQCSQPKEGNTPALTPFACFRWRLPTQVPKPEDAEADPAAKFQQIWPEGTPGAPAAGGLGVGVSFDGRCSEDFDGQIVSYAWSAPGRTETEPHFTWVFDPALGTSVTVTLVVTDSQGLQDTLQKTVVLDGPDLGTTDPETGETPPDPEGGDILPMSWIAAAETVGMYAVNGGESFNDLEPGTGGVSGLFISCTAKVYDNLDVTILFGTDAGEICRSTDFCQNGAKVAELNGQVLCLTNDQYNPRRFWAGTSTGRVYYNDDDGLEDWDQFEPFGSQGSSKPVHRILCPSDGSVIVVGGNTSDLDSLIRADARAGTGVFVCAIGGELLAAIQAVGPGYTIRDAVTSEAGDMMVTLGPLGGGTGGGLQTATFYTENVYNDGSTWKRVLEERFAKSFEIVSSNGGSTATTTFELAEAHGLASGQTVIIEGHSSDAPVDLNGEWEISVGGLDSFSIPAVSGYVGGTGGTATPVFEVTIEDILSVVEEDAVVGTEIDTVEDHGLQAGNLVLIKGVGSDELIDADGLSINDRHVVTEVLDGNRFVIDFIIDGASVALELGTAVRLDAIGGNGKALAGGYGGAGDVVMHHDANLWTQHTEDGLHAHRSLALIPSSFNRIAWEEGSSGIYLAAAPTGILKTHDYGDEFWGYVRPMDGLDPPTTWPGGAIGRDVYPLPDFGQPAGSDLMIGSSGSQILKFLRQANGVVNHTEDTTYPDVSSGDGFAADWHERYFLATTEDAGGVPHVLIFDQAEYALLTDITIDVGDGTAWSDIDVAMRDTNENDEAAVDDAGLVFVVGSTTIDGVPARGFIAYTFDGIMVGDPQYRYNRVYNPWVFVGGGADGVPTAVNSEQWRSLVFLASSSSAPVISSVVGGTAELLHAWESPTPANFGGDGYGWWKAYYVTPNEGAADVTINCTGAFKSINWYVANDDLDRAQGNNGVLLQSRQALHYPGSGQLNLHIDVSGETEYGDAAVFWTNEFVRTFDDHFFQYRFHHEDQSQFDRDQDLFNAVPSPAVKEMLADPKDDGESHEITMTYDDTITCSSLCGSARGLLTGVGVTLKTLSDPAPPAVRSYIAVDPNHAIAILDVGAEGNIVRVYQFSGGELTRVATFGTDLDGDIDMHEDGRIYGIATGGASVKVYSQSGELQQTLPIGLTAVSLTLGDGHMYVLDGAGNMEDLTDGGEHLASRSGYGVTTRGIARLKSVSD